MIPYFQLPSLPLGPLHIEPFGILVALGVWVATRVLAACAPKDGVSASTLLDFSFWALVGGVVGGHLLHLFAYHPEELRREGPLQILKIWSGLSSTGGVLGGAAAAVVFFHRRHLKFMDFADSLAIAVAVGWSIARVGCFLVHDHPGVHTSFFLAVRYPDGPRHDLGLDDALFLAGIALLIFICRKNGWLRRRHLGLLAIVYAFGRFGMDFLRAQDVAYADARYAGLTPAQFVCMGLIAFGIWNFLPSPKVV